MSHTSGSAAYSAPATKVAAIGQGKTPDKAVDANTAAAAGSAAAAGGEREFVEDLEAFVGLCRGFDPDGEKRAWFKYFKAWNKRKPDISRCVCVCGTVM